MAATVGVAAGLANVVNNLPATLIGLEGVDQATWGFWGWLLGVNVGAALLPIGALANLLWWRIARAEGVEISVRRYVRSTVPVVAAALLASAACLGAAVDLRRRRDADGETSVERSAQRFAATAATATDRRSGGQTVAPIARAARAGERRGVIGRRRSARAPAGPTANGPRRAAPN